MLHERPRESRCADEHEHRVRHRRRAHERPRQRRDDARERIEQAWLGSVRILPNKKRSRSLPQNGEVTGLACGRRTETRETGREQADEDTERETTRGGHGHRRLTASAHVRRRQSLRIAPPTARSRLSADISAPTLADVTTMAQVGMRKPIVDDSGASSGGLRVTPTKFRRYTSMVVHCTFWEPFARPSQLPGTILQHSGITPSNTTLLPLSAQVDRAAVS